MDKQTAICLLPGSAAPLGMSHCPKAKMLSRKDGSTSKKARISFPKDMTRMEAQEQGKEDFEK